VCVNSRTTTEKFHGTARAGIVLSVVLADGRVDARRRRFLVADDRLLRHARHGQCDQLAFIRQTFGQLVDAEVADAGAT